MKFYLKAKILIISILLSISANAQIGNENGQYDALINDAYRIVSDLRHMRRSAIVKRFSESGFQSKQDFKQFLSSKNMRWAKNMILTYGAPKKSDISISIWKKSSRGNDNSTSVNLTLYFAEKDAKFSPTNDNISINYKLLGDGSFVLDGFMTFKKADYLLIKEYLDSIP